MPSVLDLLKSKWTILGLDAPRFAWLAAFGLIVFTFGILFSFWRRVRRQEQLHRTTAKTIRKIATQYPLAPSEGLPLAGFDAAVRVFEQLTVLRPAWNQLSAHRISRRNARGEDQVWTSQPAQSAFNEATVVESQINRAFYSAIPGVVTGTGLLFTFLAILVALLDVRLGDDNQVKGMKLLIEGLSGKFVSSIAALASATVYVLCEKPLQQRLSRSRHELTAALDALIPVLSPSQILVDLTRDISEQSTAFRAFNADLSQKLKQSFSESMGPTLARMVEVIEDFNKLLRAAEAQKQDSIKESITGSLESLMSRLEGSMTAALGQMSSRFQASLSGGAMAQFQKVTESLSDAAGVIGRMNAQSEATQQMLSEVVALAKNSTSEQLQLGKTQITELTEVLRGLMAQLNETADTSVTRMNTTLTAVVHGLSQQVGELSEKMSNSIIDSAGLATGAANEVIQKADRWSTQSAEQLRQLLETHHSQLDTVNNLRAALEQSLAGFNGALERYTRVSTSLEQVVANVSGAAGSLAGTAKSARETHEAVQRISGLATTQLEQLANANRDQREMWRQIHHSMEQYQQLFSKVEGEASALLTQVAQHLANYVQTSQQGFEGLVKTSDEHFANATKRLGSSVNELDDVLQTLIDELSKRKGAPA